MTPRRGYQLAKELLQEHFGNKYRIAAAYIDKALAWPVVKADDVRALQDFSSLFVRLLQRIGGTAMYARTRHANQHERHGDKVSIQIQRKMEDIAA